MIDNPYLTNAIYLTDNEINEVKRFSLEMMGADKDTRDFQLDTDIRDDSRFSSDQVRGKLAEVALARFMRRGGILSARSNMVVTPGLTNGDNGIDIDGVSLKIDVKGTRHKKGSLTATTMISDVYVLFHIYGNKATYLGHAGKRNDWQELKRGDFLPNTKCRIKANIQYCITQKDIIFNLAELITKIRNHEDQVK